MPGAKIARSDHRITETPNALMATLASPTHGGTSTLSLWRVTMRAAQRGPRHAFDVEQAWHLLVGAATITVEAETFALRVGDTVVIPAGCRRQVSTDSGAEFVVTGPADGRAVTISAEGAGEPIAPAWIV
ncbi:cupin domain-containing protein [Microlunatus soli]|nr:cupin domain-containing protein [Microlunatus soli]